MGITYHLLKKVSYEYTSKLDKIGNSRNENVFYN